MAKSTKGRKFFFVPDLSSAFSRLKFGGDVEVGVNLGIFSATTSLSRTEPASVPPPARVGLDDDAKTPFVHTSLDTLYQFYPAYQSTMAYQQWAPYAEIIPLHDNGRGFTNGVDVRTLRIKLRQYGYALPMSLQRHREAAIKQFKMLGRLRFDLAANQFENNQSARIISWSADSPLIEIQKADYFSQVGSNLTMDWASGCLATGSESQTATIRNTVEPPLDGRLKPLGQSVLANTLGVAVVLLTADHHLLIPIRGDAQAIMHSQSGQFHCSASGVFNWSAFQGAEEASFDALERGMQAEIKSELHLDEADYQLTPLLFARELARGGKPQLFFFAECRLKLNEVRRAMQDADESWEFLREDELPAGSPIQQYLGDRETVDPDKPTVESCFTHEGWTGFVAAKAFVNNMYPF